MVKFGMQNTLVNFREKFYIYQGAAKGQNLMEEDVALAIGAYESAFFADLVALFVFEKTAVCFKLTLLRGIYQDNGLVVFEGRRMKLEIAVWLKSFQANVNKLADGEYLQFTTELWRPVKDATHTTTHLDDGDGWGDDGEISKALWKKAAVYQKENQLLKYVYTQSTHRPSTFPSIATG
eukprot:5498846-Ditylum_brightwellii.AAC.1